MNLIQKDKQYIWHPFTQMKTADEHLGIVRGEGTYLYTENGDQYLDAISSWWVNVHGHSHPHIAACVSKQLQTLEHVIFAGFTHPPAVELAERILGHLPDNQGKVFFSDNGSTAVEVALKMAIQYFYNQGEKRPRIVALENAYHGDTFGAMSAGAKHGFNIPFHDYFFEVERVPTPVPGRENDVLEQFGNIIANGDVSCFIFEPLVQGSGGMIMYEPWVLDEMVAICRKAGVLCIADEVMTGFYRTGKMFATDYLENKPDIYCLSKGLTGGTLPLSLTTCTDEIYNAFWSDDKMKALFHGHSFTGNPLGCAAALASLDIFESEGYLDKIQSLADAQNRAAIHFRKEFPGLKDVRVRGTILALEFDTGEATSYFSSRRDELYRFFLSRGLILRPLGNVIYFMPPYCISPAAFDTVIEAIQEAVTVFSESSKV